MMEVFICGEDFTCIRQIGSGFPRIFRSRVANPLDKVACPISGSFVSKNSFDFKFFFIIDDIWGWSRMCRTVSVILMVGS